jgi:hypothetical protein
VPKYHVEFDFETFGSEELRVGDFLPIPADAVITEIAPVAVAGWYQSIRGNSDIITFWRVEEIEGGWDTIQDFLDTHTRMKAPEPWVEEPEAKYKDGYYRMDDGYLYRREAGKWSLQWRHSLDWDESSYDDDDIESDNSVTYLGVDAP